MNKYIKIIIMLFLALIAIVTIAMVNNIDNNENSYYSKLKFLEIKINEVVKPIKIAGTNELTYIIKFSTIPIGLNEMSYNNTPYSLENGSNYSLAISLSYYQDEIQRKRLNKKIIERKVIFNIDRPKFEENFKMPNKIFISGSESIKFHECILKESKYLSGKMFHTTRYECDNLPLLSEYNKFVRIYLDNE